MPMSRTVTLGARILVLLVVASFAAAPAFGRVEAPKRSALETGVLTQINVVRREHGLAPLRLNVRLRAAADMHSRAMVTGGFFSHESRDGTAFWKRVARFYPQGSRRYWSVGENLLWSSPDVDAAGAVRMWLNSPPHRENLLNARWREVGLSAVHVEAGHGVFGTEPVTVLTADFGVRR
jgi:uncharacterized protein YkwD